MAKNKSFVAMPFGENPPTSDMLSEFIGKTVCVSWIKDQEHGRNSFEPQISVQSTLEGSQETGKFRVLLDEDTYSYFYADSVWMIAYDGEKTVTDKQRPVIFIN